MLYRPYLNLIFIIPLSVDRVSPISQIEVEAHRKLVTCAWLHSSWVERSQIHGFSPDPMVCLLHTQSEKLAPWVADKASQSRVLPLQVGT